VRQSLVHTLVVFAALGCATGLTGCAARGRTLSVAIPRDAAARTATAPEVSLGEYIEKIRHVSAAARPAPVATSVPTLEDRDPELAAALARLRGEPSAESQVLVGELYRVRGVLDSAYKHFTAAVRLTPSNADAYEGLAKTWRDWRAPTLALSDAARARFHAPQSASVQNTLGTILQALGRRDEARRAYERAVALEANATYALNNLCYLSFLEGQMDLAVSQCQRAVALEPQLKSARYNLALAYAGAGEMDLARAALSAGGDDAEASFNLGILHMAQRDYRSAAAAFDAASRARPTLNVARERALQARVLMRAAPPEATASPYGGEK
jgi:Flp pilus assembly protein TadD